jgi:hypothetical protein
MIAKLTPAQELSYFLDYSMTQMEDMKQTGYVSNRLYKHYCFLWLWGSGIRTSIRHERFYRVMGSDAYWRRIERVRRIIDCTRSLDKPAPEHVPFALGRLYTTT